MPLSIPILVGAAQVAGTAATVTTELTGSVVNSLLAEHEWEGEEDAKGKIDSALQKRNLHSREIQSRLERDPYAISPIMEYMKSRCRRRGTVYVAHVPPGMGKTTACYAFLEKHPKRKVLFLSPDVDSSLTYLDHMVSLFGFEKGKAPSGFVPGLISAMDVPFTNGTSTNPASYLLLDDFMPGEPNLYDSDLIRAIKGYIRGRNIIVVVLTANKKSANYLLTLNNLAYIVPLFDLKSTDAIKSTLGGRDIPTDFEVDWDKYLSMEWDAEQMKIATLANPLFSATSNEEREALRNKIDLFLNGMVGTKRKFVQPADILDYLADADADLVQNATSTLSPANARTAGNNQNNIQGYGCGACSIM